MVRIFKNRNKGGNGCFVVQTDCIDFQDFLCQLAPTILEALKNEEGDEDFAIGGILQEVLEISLSLKGYKTERVHIQKMLISGFSHPSECDEIASNTSPSNVNKTPKGI